MQNMHQKKQILLIIVLLFGSFNLMHAQRTVKEIKPKEPKPKIYKKPITRKPKSANDILEELSAGIGVQPFGWSIGIQRLRKNAESESEDYQGFFINFENIDDAREAKVTSKLPNPTGDKGPRNLKFVYGKINSMYPIKLGYMRRKSLTDKLEKNNIRIHALGGAAVAIGLIKPYYLQIARNNAGSFTAVDEKYSEANAELFLNPRYVYGYSGFAKGWSDVDVVPGINLQAAIQFEYSPSYTNPILIEIGGQIDAYLRKLPLMIGDKNKAIFPFGYIAVRKGLRW
jgi:hypothetical protein